MSSRAEVRRRRLAAAVAVAACVVALMGCATAAVERTLLGAPGCKRGADVFLLVDTSRSTDGERRAGGPYERAVMDVVRTTARRCGRLFAASADGNAIANAAWTIDGAAFTEALGGNAKLNADMRARAAARKLRGRVQELLHRRLTEGSDMLGALTRAALTAKAMGGRRKILVLLSDGALLVRGRYDLYRTPLTTPAQRRALVARLRRMGELPSLRAFDAVYLGGLALGVRGHDDARGILALWPELVHAAGGRLVSADSTLRFP